MPDHDLLVAFFLATATFAYLPGPAMLYTAGQTMARGHRAGSGRWLRRAGGVLLVGLGIRLAVVRG